MANCNNRLEESSKCSSNGITNYSSSEKICEDKKFKIGNSNGMKSGLSSFDALEKAEQATAVDFNGDKLFSINSLEPSGSFTVQNISSYPSKFHIIFCRKLFCF